MNIITQNPKIKLNADEISRRAAELRAGDEILLSGTVYTARDAAHKRIAEILAAGGDPPFPIAGAVIYYAGPTPPREGAAAGSFGPTTSSRMDGYTPDLLERGLAAAIGKGNRSAEVIAAMVKHGAPYLCAIGGAGALAAGCVAECREIAFAELGCESVKRLEIVEFPLIVGIDCFGNTLFK